MLSTVLVYTKYIYIYIYIYIYDSSFNNGTFCDVYEINLPFLSSSKKVMSDAYIFYTKGTNEHLR